MAKGSSGLSSRGGVTPKNEGTIYGSDEYGYFTQKGVDEIVNAGGKFWSNYGKTRIYLGSMKLLSKFGLELTWHKSGNISGASINGEGISNGDGTRIRSFFNRTYVDLDTGSIVAPFKPDRYVVQYFYDKIFDFVNSKRYSKKG